MQIVNCNGRSGVMRDGRIVDLERASDGRLPSDPMQLLPLLPWVSQAINQFVPTSSDPVLSEVTLSAPVPRPAKIYAVGLNYQDHAAETGAQLPEEPVVFAKLPNALCGDGAAIVLADGRTQIDWEAELVVAIGRRGRAIPRHVAWEYVVGLMCGQDISDRAEQSRGLRQFTLAKSLDTFAPIGPALVTVDELRDKDDLAIRCRLNGEIVQEGSTKDMIFDIPALIEWISRSCTLEPGDLIFTGTPSGVGLAASPPRFLVAGDQVETEIEGLGVLHNICVKEDEA